MKKKIFLIFCLVMGVAILFYITSLSKNVITVSEDDIKYILIANNKELTTKTVEKSNKADITTTLSFLNGLKKSKNDNGELIGQIDIYYLDSSIIAYVYENACSINNLLYSSEGFDFSEFFAELKEPAVSFKR